MPLLLEMVFLGGACFRILGNSLAHAAIPLLLHLDFSLGFGLSFLSALSPSSSSPSTVEVEPLLELRRHLRLAVRRHQLPKKTISDFIFIFIFFRKASSTAQEDHFSASSSSSVRFLSTFCFIFIFVNLAHLHLLRSSSPFQ